MRYMGKGLSRDRALEIASLTRHRFYHIPSGTKGRGRARSTHTPQMRASGSVNVPNALVEAEMMRIDRNPDLSCGALRMTQQLQLKGFVINRKKTARMMTELGIVKASRRKGRTGTRQFATFRIVNATQPLSFLEMDIKQFWLIAERRAVYVITVIDTFTREALGYHKGYSVKATDVKALWDRIIEEHLEPAGMAAGEVVIEIRTDNGPQFVAEFVRTYFKENGLSHVFTKPYTPQENGHIESFHGIMGRSMGNTFFRITEFDNRLEKFYKTYNHARAHTATKGLPPAMFRKAWEADLVITCYDKRRPTRIKLRYPIYQIPGILSQREHLAKTNRAKRNHLKTKGGEKTSSANNVRTPVNTSPSVASCVAKEVSETSLN